MSANQQVSESVSHIVSKYVKQIVLPKIDSHKGENGKVLVIGGSKLFHAASFWAAAAASKIVDMVHFSSPMLENNELMRIRAKDKFWEGIVVPWEEVAHYIEEDDCILIGPGMERGEETRGIVDELLAKYPKKRWVVDGGALQEVAVKLLRDNMVVTPNKKEWEIIESKGGLSNQVTVLLKGQEDVITRGSENEVVSGGSPAMTKGGTGDVLSGVVAGLYAKSPAMAAAVVASYVNKQAGERLSKKVGVYFGAGELIPEVQRVLNQVIIAQ